MLLFYLSYGKANRVCVSDKKRSILASFNLRVDRVFSSGIFLRNLPSSSCIVQFCSIIPNFTTYCIQEERIRPRFFCLGCKSSIFMGQGSADYRKYNQIWGKNHPWFKQLLTAISEPQMLLLLTTVVPHSSTHALYRECHADRDAVGC